MYFLEWVYRIQRSFLYIYIYILGVVVCTKMTDGAVYGLIASFSAVLLFNYFFTVPYYSLQVDDSNYPITFFIMGITSLITSTITSSEKKSALHARYEADQANAFYELTSSLRDTVSMEEAEKAIVRSFSKTFHVEAAFLPRRSQTDSCVNLQGAEYYAWPILGKEEPYGILYIPAANAEAFDKTQLLLVDSMCECAALGLEKTESLVRQIQIQEQMVQEHYRSDLLRSISHDLRTPLSGIMGICELLLNTNLPATRRNELVAGILQETGWLYSLVENILNLTRMEEGQLRLNRQPECAEELAEAAIRTTENRHPGRPIQFSIPEELILIDVDGKLVVQLLVNLLENAIRHTRNEGAIEMQLFLSSDQTEAVFAIQDEGDGILSEDLPHLFEPFYTGKKSSQDKARGVGLGLAICQSIVQAHGGRIRAENRLDFHGARFEVTLPLNESPSEKTES
ncbi:ATP-binding protein [Ileibacterium valens]|uniref:ATP-binding protein n=1 Tax=Ileibacterium valens TaxID=1862668 RepID=UPI002573E663|nr:ATP-binding protein [Ileibacterium valens]